MCIILNVSFFKCIQFYINQFLLSTFKYYLNLFIIEYYNIILHNISKLRLIFKCIDIKFKNKKAITFSEHKQ